MQLFTNPASPFCRKVDVVLKETGQAGDVNLFTLKANPLGSPEELAAVNPIGKIPTLVAENGQPLYDSRVICRFLNDRAGGSLYPEASLWDVLTVEATGDGMCEGAVLMVYENRFRPEDIRFGPWVEGQWAKIQRSLDVLETQWMPLLNGPLNAGQIAVGCALGYLDFRHGDRDWRTGRDGLAAWFEEFSKRPSMTETLPSD